jgi:hypothetical protein
LGEYAELIDEWLIADQLAPRKQRHTAKRIWRRLVDEHGELRVLGAGTGRRTVFVADGVERLSSIPAEILMATN